MYCRGTIPVWHVDVSPAVHQGPHYIVEATVSSLVKGRAAVAILGHRPIADRTGIDEAF